jgi:4-methyl-5(b-hydroxyethyl)-thiazole monophosphate biosynthesis
MTNTSKVTKKVLLLLADGFELMEMSGFTDIMAWASFLDDINIEVTSASIHPTVKTAFGGLTVTPQAQLNELDLNDFDALVIPGGMEWAGFFKDAYSKEFTDTIKHFFKYKNPILAVCVASLSLGHANILKNKNASIYHSERGKHKAALEKHGANFVDRPVVRDGNITTSSGPGTSIEVAFSLLHDLTNEKVVAETRKIMRIPTPSRSWDAPQVK